MLLALHLLAVAVVRRWPLYQIDVKNVFFNGDLQEEMYMQPPLAIHTQEIKFVAFAVLFMASSRLLEFGLKILAQLLLNRVSLRVLMTLFSLSKILCWYHSYSSLC